MGLAFLPGARPARAQNELWRPEERVLISAFHQVYALSTDQRHLYAASGNGLQCYDFVTNTWQLPSTREDGYPVFEQPSAAAYDILADGVWVGTLQGSLYFWSRLSGRWQRQAFGAPAITRIVPGRQLSNAAAYLATRGGWLRLGSGSWSFEPVSLSDVPVEIREQLRHVQTHNAAWEVMRGTVTVDRSGRRWQITDAIPAERNGTLWVGTDGGNFLLADTRNMSTEWFAYGTLSRGTSALALDETGRIWFGGDGLGPRNGISIAENELQNWSYIEPVPQQRGPRRRVYALLVRGDTLWAGAADGLFVGAAAVGLRQLDESHGLTTADVRALAATSYAIWAGTAAGLVALNSSAAPSRSLLPGQRINALSVRRDTLWVASSRGLMILPSADGALEPPHGASLQPALRTAVSAIATTAESAIAVTAVGVYLQSAEGWSGPMRHTALAAIGQITTVETAEDVAWFGGTNGLARWHMKSGEWRYLNVPQDIPEGPVLDILPRGDLVWLATPAGALRLKWPQ